MELKILSDIEYTKLILEGFYKGIMFSITVGFIAQGINYAYKLLSRS